MFGVVGGDVFGGERERFTWSDRRIREIQRKKDTPEVTKETGRKTFEQRHRKSGKVGTRTHR